MTLMLSCEVPFRSRIEVTKSVVSNAVTILARPKTSNPWTLSRDLMTASGVDHFVYEMDRHRLNLDSAIAARYQVMRVSTVVVGMAECLHPAQLAWLRKVCIDASVKRILLLHGTDTGERVQRNLAGQTTIEIPWHRAKRLMPKSPNGECFRVDDVEACESDPSIRPPDVVSQYQHLRIPQLIEDLSQKEHIDTGVLREFFYEKIQQTDNPFEALKLVEAIKDCARVMSASVSLNEQALWHVVNEAQHRPLSEMELAELWQISNPAVAAAAVLLDAGQGNLLDSLTVQKLSSIVSSESGHKSETGRALLRTFDLYHQIKGSRPTEPAFDPVGRQLTQSLRSVSLNLNLPLQVAVQRDGRRTLDIYDWIDLEWKSA